MPEGRRSIKMYLIITERFVMGSSVSLNEEFPYVPSKRACMKKDNKCDLFDILHATPLICNFIECGDLYSNLMVCCCWWECV